MSYCQFNPEITRTGIVITFWMVFGQPHAGGGRLRPAWSPALHPARNERA